MSTRREIAERILKLRDSPEFAGRNDLRWFLGRLIVEVVLPNKDGSGVTPTTGDIVEELTIVARVERAVNDHCAQCPHREQLLKKLLDLVNEYT